MSEKVKKDDAVKDDAVNTDEQTAVEEVGHADWEDASDWTRPFTKVCLTGIINS